MDRESRREPRQPAPPAMAAGGRQRTGTWTFLTNHAHVLVRLAAGDDPRLRDVAERVGITERAVQKILADLEREGLVTRRREGRRNRYELHLDQPLRHPLEARCPVRRLVRLVAES